jgi:hypothetical protein
MSLVQELQRDAIGSTVPTSELLRKALVVARKLGVNKFSEWITLELKGYPRGSEIPDYRKLHGQLQAKSPFHGWIPVMLHDLATIERLTITRVKQPIGELESMVEHRKMHPETTIIIPYSMAALAGIQWDDDDLDMPVALHLDAAHIEGIATAIRNAVLEWSLKLEEDGIMGEGLSFSQEEKQLAASNHYNIGNYVENMNQSQIQQNTQDSTQSYANSGFDAQAVATLLREFSNWVEDAPLEDEQKAEIVADLQTVESQTKSPKPKNAIVKAGLSSVKSVLEQAAIKTLSTEAPHYAAQAAHWVEKLHHLIGSIAS